MSQPAQAQSNTQHNSIALKIFDHEFKQVYAATLSELAPQGETLTGKFNITLDGTAYEMDVSGKTIQVPAGGMSLLNGAAGRFSVSINLILGPYIPAYTGGILFGNTAMATQFFLIGIPDGMQPSQFGSEASLDTFVQQLKQLGPA
ncbi:hypothetical protein [Andreprevotia chitinilytica]|uniref:hypothetical protein n=1 Tax=Andreprevotia chitinilytica TaxID=396808 RepID=UPI000550CC26|nr:hypothetical protein [Andreprevotia chitinilytica]